LTKLVSIGKIDKEVFIEYLDIDKKVMFSFKFGNCYVHTKVDPKTWIRFIRNCKKQREEQGKTKTKVLSGISPDEILYVDNFELEKRYAKTAKEKKLVSILEKVIGKDKLPSKDLVSNDLSISMGDFNIMLDKKEYFKVRDCIISSEKKLKKIV
jgi:hypothetical protein